MESIHLNLEDIFRDLPPLETERLLLRKLHLADAEDMFEYGRDPDVTRFLMWEPHRTVADSTAFIGWVLEQYENGRLAPWGIELLDTGKFIGTIGFHVWNTGHRRAEIGYSLARPYWGQGIMTEAARTVIAFGFQVMGLNRIEATCFPENVGSARVMEKCGMKFEATVRQYEFIKGRYEDLNMYSILRSEWESQATKSFEF